MKKPLLMILMLSAALAAQQWPSFRGENASGQVKAAFAVTEWDTKTDKNIRWHQTIPGIGHASPIIWDNQIIVATAISMSDATTTPATSDNARNEWWLYSLDKNSGAVLWKTMATAANPRAGHHPKANQCNSTPATNGKVIAAILGSQGLFVFDMTGRLLWEKDLGLLDPGLASDPASQWGHGSSPIIYDNKIIVQCDRHSNSFVAAFDSKNGKEIWRQDRAELPSWSTPIIAMDNNRAVLVTNGGNAVRGYRVDSGELVWSFSDTAQVKVPTPLLIDDQLVLTGGYPRGRPFVSIPLGLKGQIFTEHLNWKLEKGGPYTVTPVGYQSLIYSCTDVGIFSCIDANSGELVYRQRLDGNYSASPIVANGLIYLPSEEGEVQVIKAGREFELLAVNSMPAGCFATPALSGNRMIIRTTEAIYCVESS